MSDIAFAFDQRTSRVSAPETPQVDPIAPGIWPSALFLRQYELSDGRSSRGRCTASSIRSRSRRCRTTACHRSRWPRAGWNDARWFRGTARAARADAARYVSRAGRTRWTASWTTRRTCTPTPRPSASLRTRTSTRSTRNQAPSTMTESRRSVGTATLVVTPTGSRRQSTWQCHRRPCGRKTCPTATRTRPAIQTKRRARQTGIRRGAVPPATSPTTGRPRPSSARCSGKVRAIPRSSRRAHRAWTARTSRSCMVIDQPAPGPVTVTTMVSGRRRRCPIGPTWSDRVSDSSSSAAHPLIRTRWFNVAFIETGLCYTQPRENGDRSRDDRVACRTKRPLRNPVYRLSAMWYTRMEKRNWLNSRQWYK